MEGVLGGTGRKGGRKEERITRKPSFREGEIGKEKREGKNTAHRNKNRSFLMDFTLALQAWSNFVIYAYVN